MTINPKAYVDPSDVAGVMATETGARDAITAYAGGGQANAVLLTRTINRVTTVATAGDSVKLPVAVPGMQIIVINADSTDSMNVFPATNGYINALTQNSALAVAANKTVLFVCAVAGRWNAIVTA